MPSRKEAEGRLNRQQGYFGEKAVELLAAAGGLSCSRPDIDFGSDVLFEAPDGDVCRVQVKTTRADVAVLDGSLRYSLDIDTYDRLRRLTTVPLFLILIRVCALPTQPIECKEWEFVVRGTANYVSLRGEPATENATSVTVSLPLVNVVSPDVLRRLTEGGAN